MKEKSNYTSMVKCLISYVEMCRQNHVLNANLLKLWGAAACLQSADQLLLKNSGFKKMHSE